MSNKNKTKNEKDDEPDFLYDYGNTTIYKNQYAKNVKADGHIKIPFKVSDSVANPNLIVSSSNTKCETTNLYVFKNIHNIKEATESYDGELIIEHEPVTNSYEKYYVCFLLKTDNSLGKTNVLDKIINNTMESSETVNLNKLIPEKSKCIMNNVPNVFIFTTPIHIMSNFDKFKDMVDSGEKKFAYSSEKFQSSIGKKGTSEGFSGMMKYQEGYQEGVESMDIGTDTYLECSMNGASDDSEVITTTIDSNFAKIIGTNKSLNSVLNLFMILIAVFIGSFLVPFFYKITLLNMVKNSLVEDDKKAGSLRGLDIIILLWSLIGAMILLSTSSSIENSSGTLSGSIFLIVIILSAIIIFFFKTTDPTTYTLYSETSTSGINLEFIKKLLESLFNNPGSTGVFLILGLVAIWIALPVSGKFNVFSPETEKSISIASMIAGIITVVWIPLVVFTIYNYNKQ